MHLIGAYVGLMEVKDKDIDFIKIEGFSIWLLPSSVVVEKKKTKASQLFVTCVQNVLYAVDKGLRGRNVLHQLLLILLRIYSQSVRPILYMYVLLYNCDIESNLLCRKCDSMSRNLVGFLCNCCFCSFFARVVSVLYWHFRSKIDERQRGSRAFQVYACAHTYILAHTRLIKYHTVRLLYKPATSHTQHVCVLKQFKMMNIRQWEFWLSYWQNSERETPGTNWDEEIEAVKRLKNGRSPGEDGVVVDMLKAGVRSCCWMPIWHLKKSVENKEGPGQWSGRVQCWLWYIRKKNDWKICDIYWGMALLGISKTSSPLPDPTRAPPDHHNPQLQDSQCGFKEGARNGRPNVGDTTTSKVGWWIPDSYIFLGLVDLIKAYNSVDCSTVVPIMTHYKVIQQIAKIATDL